MQRFMVVGAVIALTLSCMMPRAGALAATSPGTFSMIVLARDGSPATGATHFYSLTGQCTTGVFSGTGSNFPTTATEVLTGRIGSGTIIYRSIQSSPPNGYSYDVVAHFTSTTIFNGGGRDSIGGTFSTVGQIISISSSCSSSLLSSVQ